MHVKRLEVRDSCTFIAVVAVTLESDVPEEAYLLQRMGFYGRERTILIFRPDCNKSNWDPNEWPNRTMVVAHNEIVAKWNDIKGGDVIDVEYILGITSTPKKSENDIIPDWMKRMENY